jgi:NAD(P)-dependent dehydrogenase (short-subunit alcohol dehydrogenase family)
MTAVLITGANRGLGFEFASQYAAAGWHVIAACRDPAAASGLRRLGEEAGERLTVVPMDVTSAQSVQRAAEQFKDRAVDLLVNNAGVAGPRGQTAGNVDFEAWAHVLDVNTMGPVRVLQAFIEHLARSERRLAVTITSGMSSIADNKTGGSIPYRSSKAGVNMAMRSAAIDLAPRGIVCAVLSPGWVRTDMGGPGAALPVADSVMAMRRVIEKLGPGDSGKFYNYDGREFPW